MRLALDPKTDRRDHINTEYYPGASPQYLLQCATFEGGVTRLEKLFEEAFGSLEAFCAGCYLSFFLLDEAILQVNHRWNFRINI